MRFLLCLLVAMLLSFPVIIDDGRICWSDSNGHICVTFGDAMGIASRLEGLLQ